MRGAHAAPPSPAHLGCTCLSHTHPSRPRLPPPSLLLQVSTARRLVSTIELSALPSVGDLVEARTDDGCWAEARVTSVSSDGRGSFGVVWGGALRAGGLSLSRVRRREATWDLGE